jgi:hypothetical protein
MDTGDEPLPGTQEPTFSAWNYRYDAGWSAEHDIVGYRVVAADGHLGKIEQASHGFDDSFLIVDTGPWIFGHKVIVPAGTVTHIDHDGRRVYVDRRKEDIRSAPAYGGEIADLDTGAVYRDKLSGYYLDTYRAG